MNKEWTASFHGGASDEPPEYIAIEQNGLEVAYLCNVDTNPGRAGDIAIQIVDSLNDAATLRTRCQALEGALRPFAEISECGVGLIVDVHNDEHNLKCYECQRIINARAALAGGGGRAINDDPKDWSRAEQEGGIK